MPDLNFTIRHVDFDTGQIVVEVPDLDTSIAIDLPINDEGEVPSGENLRNYIKGFIPTFEIERRAKIRQGIKNRADIEFMIEPYPEPEPEESEPESLPPLLDYAKIRRWEVETGGITVFGIPIFTDDRSKLLLLGARQDAVQNPSAVEKWDAADGVVYEIVGSQIIAMSNAVKAHTSNCFNTYAAIREKILSGEITTHEQIDAVYQAMNRDY